MITPGEVGGSLRLATTVSGVAKPYDPAALSLTGWWRNFSGAPWTGTASAGTSGSHSLVEATHPPTAGASLNGYGTASFNGTNAHLTSNATSLSDYVGASAGSYWILFKASVAAPAATNVYVQPALISLQSAGFLMCAYDVSGVRASIYDVAYVEADSAASLATWHLAQVKWNGTTLSLRVDNDPWQSVAAGAIGGLGFPVQMGTSWDATAFYTGLIAEFGIVNSVLTDDDFNGLRSYCNTRYGVSV